MLKLRATGRPPLWRSIHSQILIEAVDQDFHGIFVLRDARRLVCRECYSTE